MFHLFLEQHNNTTRFFFPIFIPSSTTERRKKKTTAIIIITNFFLFFLFIIYPSKKIKIKTHNMFKSNYHCNPLKTSKATFNYLPKFRPYTHKPIKNQQEQHNKKIQNETNVRHMCSSKLRFKIGKNWGFSELGFFVKETIPSDLLVFNI